MKRKLFIESIQALDLPSSVTSTIIKLHDACFEAGFKPAPLTVPTSVVMNTNIYDSIKRPMGTADSKNTQRAYQSPNTKSTSPNANRDYGKETQQTFRQTIHLKKQKPVQDPQIAKMIKGANSHLPTPFVADVVGRSMMPMATGYSSPSRHVDSPYTQGVDVSASDGGGGGSAPAS